MNLKTPAAFLSACVLANAAPGLAQEPQYKPGPLHYRTCVDTTITKVQPRKYISGPNGAQVLPLSNYGFVQFATRLGEEGVTALGYDRKGATYVPVRLHPYASVLFGDSPDAEVAAAERAGDRVQVCLLALPEPTQSCNPETDPRGRHYRVWDYRQHAAYIGVSGEHECGGA
jgi:hypothetical protein